MKTRNPRLGFLCRLFLFTGPPSSPSSGTAADSSWTATFFFRPLDAFGLADDAASALMAVGYLMMSIGETTNGGCSWVT